MHCPDFVFISVHFSLYMAAAPQGNSNTNFANFEAFGNTAIPSHLSTSPPSKSFTSGTPPTTLPLSSSCHIFSICFLLTLCSSPAFFSTDDVWLNGSASFFFFFHYLNLHVWSLNIDFSLSYKIFQRGECANPIHVQCRPCTVSERKPHRGSLCCSGWVGQWAQHHCLYREQCARVRDWHP